MLATDARGEVTRERRGSSPAMMTERTYDPVTGRPDTVCSGVACALQDWDYDYDAVGNLTRARATDCRMHRHAMWRSSSTTRSARLQSARLTTHQGAASSRALVALTYDRLGNIYGKDGVFYRYGGRSGCVGSLGESSAPHAVIAAGDTDFRYDANGNQTSATGTSGHRQLRFDAQDRVASITVGSGPRPLLQSTFRYAPDDSPTLRIDAGPTGKRVTRQIGNVESVTTEDGRHLFRRYLGGVAVGLIGENSFGELRYLFGDHQGSLDTVADGAGHRVEALAYSPTGERRDRATYGLAALAPVTLARGFTGPRARGYGRRHHHAGCTPVRPAARGRFLQADATVDTGAQGLNRHGYVLGQPAESDQTPAGMRRGSAGCVLPPRSWVTVYTGGAAAGAWSFFGASVTTAAGALGAFPHWAGLPPARSSRAHCRVAVYGAFSIGGLLRSDR
ncbi:hypothetical protein PEC18_34950 [Paucibacter sp. O1-1]|nr:hypothetical protein [Paucibacter sp. O1-1]MDA3830875.1 hypothetical protein [Paucibacter sp. O1-1]